MVISITIKITIIIIIIIIPEFPRSSSLVFGSVLSAKTQCFNIQRNQRHVLKTYGGAPTQFAGALNAPWASVVSQWFYKLQKNTQPKTKSDPRFLLDASPSTYPRQSVGQWVSQSVIVSDLEIAIAFPSFASLFLNGAVSPWLTLVNIS